MEVAKLKPSHGSNNTVTVTKDYEKCLNMFTCCAFIFWGSYD